MALFECLYSANPTLFNVRAVSAGNPAEMVTKLNAEVAAAITAGETAVVDFKISGTGAGPNWQAWFVTVLQGAPGTPTIDLAACIFVAAVAGNPVESRESVLAQLAQISPAPSFLFKLEVAGGGIGTIFMAVALAAPGGQ